MISQNELLLKGAQVRLQELTQEIRDLMHHFPSLPKSITITVTAGSTPVTEKKDKKKPEALQRNQTMMDKWGTLSVAKIKQMKDKGMKPGEWRRGLIHANSGSEAVNTNSH